jgi:hypothetical protein
MKTIIIAICLFGGLLMQGCVAYVEPTGGYYYRENFWFYRDRHGMEQREHGRYHLPVGQQRDEQHHDEHGK